MGSATPCGAPRGCCRPRCRNRTIPGLGATVASGKCDEPGPWGAVCTDYPGHRYSHYDGGKDSSWQDDWRDWLDDDADESTRLAFFESEPKSSDSGSTG